MRVPVRRLLGASALYLLFGLQLPGCSGQSQDDESMEASGQEDQSADNVAEGGDDQAAPQNAAEGGEEAVDDTGGDNATAAEGNNATENDLQEIIQEMNGQQGSDPTAAGGAAGANQQAAVAPPVVDAASTNAAGPMVDPAASAAPVAPVAQSSGPTFPFQPGGTPAGPGLPELGSKMAYVVERGDTLGKISQKIYGTPGRWNELATLSGIPNPSRIYPGDLVYYTLDEGATNFAAAYEATQRSEEQVKPGDTLATIAQRIYGSTTAWRAIWRQNDRIDNPDVVPPGTVVLYIPKGAATAAVKRAQAALKLANASSAKKAPQQLAQQRTKAPTAFLQSVRLGAGLGPVKQGLNPASGKVLSSSISATSGVLPLLI